MVNAETDSGDERSASAGEYVLGTLAAAERAAFEARLHGDAALQAEVYAWQDRLLGIARRVAPADVEPGGWRAIEARLGRADAVSPSSPSQPLPLAAADAPAANDPQWRRLRRWQLTSGLALAASVLLATALWVRGPVAPAGAARYLAVLQSPGNDHDAGWIVEATAGGQVRLIPTGAVATVVPAGKALQFWTKAEGAAGPTSLGLVTAGATVSLPVSRLPTLGPRQLFELTLEPAGGSPLPRPSGPVLFLGRSLQM